MEQTSKGIDEQHACTYIKTSVFIMFLFIYEQIFIENFLNQLDQVFWYF